ncbi:MAG: HAMP domain-containing sensor histidine kinase [Planctomycetota bacterium]|jgi:signal transduction histidine kinase|nr:HAMP domain-containing sensor histidine kinase [Planctomycetota bacterium]
MRRLNLVLVGMVLLLLGGVAALLWRGFTAIDKEQDLAHQLLAERLFDEFERELDVLVRSEDSRSFADYRYFVIPEAQVPGSVGVSRSPLVAEPRAPYLLGYLQRDPDGSLGNPLIPDNAELAESLGFAADPSEYDFLKRATGWFAGGNPAEQAEKAEQALLASLVVTDAANIAQIQHESLPNQQKESLLMSSISSNGYLNRGAASRGGRSSKVMKVASQSVYNYIEPAEDNVVQQQVLQNNNDDSFAPAARALYQEIEASAVAVEVAPLQGRIVADGALLLERAVTIADNNYTQAVAIDLPALTTALSTSVLAADPLREVVHLAWGDEPDPVGDYRFAYTFAPPFADIHLKLGLEPIPGQVPTGRGPMLALAGLVALVVLLGAVAVQRMVSTRLMFARRRSDFVAAVTHELKTPLTSIRMYGEMLQQDMVPDAETRRRYVDVITAEGERLSRLVENVLDLARLERGEHRNQVEVGKPRELLEAALRVCRPHVEGKGFSLELACSEDLPAVRCDHDALVQVLVNLVDNACKFAAGANCTVVALQARCEGQALVISVRDHGPGVPEAQLRRICEPFFRGERELTRRTKGTGIGLALVRGLVDGMGGQLQLRNHPEGGLQVDIRLALA